MSYNTGLQSNTEELQEILRQVNELPDIGSIPSEAVLYVEQSLTEEQKAQVRENIGAAATTIKITPAEIIAMFES